MIVYRRVKGLLYKDYERQTSILPATTLRLFKITLFRNGLLKIDKGYAWDFASGAWDTDSIKESSMVHDALCELINENLLPNSYWDDCADIMQEISQENGRWKWLTRLECRAIKIAGADVTVSRKIITL